MLMRPSSDGLVPVPRSRRLASIWMSCARELSNVMSGAVSICTSKCMPLRMPVRGRGVRTGSADCARMELKSDCGLKPVRTIVTVPASVLRSSSRSS